ncbi:MAG: hypothetical protein JRJ39_00375 [Deltaproteobacteria bacterium]|nr:hypothetical protein [Deltaproteobacteria bacterium]MBW1845563.1 hypothetical protein [Deltaproteobacteria bacterium]MBW2031993.1 hypothetical protein [Deltaproteobacteria bacterium]
MDWDFNRITDVLLEVRGERENQHLRYGNNPFNDTVYNMMLVLAEEVGEVSAALVETRVNEMEADSCTSASLCDKYITKAEAAIKHARKELIQVSAVAVAMVELIDSLKREESTC